MRNAKQIENLKLVREVIQAKIDRNEPPEILNEYVQPCGTYGCVLGDYIIRQHPKFKGDESALYNLCLWVPTKEEFGISVQMDNIIFGPSEFGSLEHRLDLVDQLIEESTLPGETP